MADKLKRHRSPATSMAGFTLLEVLAALIIFAIAFGALATLFQTSIRQASNASDLRRATELAKTQLARFGKDLPLETGQSEGATADGLRWRVEISLANRGEDIALYRLRIETFAADRPSGFVDLTTFRVGRL